ncbi:MAG: DUF3576 domain-containing protein [Azospirillum sp.]|nr:DUF3576 domain-containing protein [Azospirillum sp.]MCZ8121838.1 DUF3576 domain-containing protein [Magnetospirillum sp.]
MRHSAIRGFLAIGLVGLLSACGGARVEHNYPAEVPGSDGRYAPSDQISRGGVFGEDGLFGGPRRQEEQGGGIGVNALLWRASLETISFMPVVSADPFGGVIITDWFSPAETPSERFKINIYILGRQLRADGVKATVFKQQREASGNWVDSPVDAATATQVENSILTRARQIRQQAGR